MFEDLLRRLQMDVSALANTLLTLFASAVPKGKLTRARILSGGTTAVVTHGLGRPAQGAFVAGASAAGAFTVDLITTTTTLTVRASAAVGSNVDLVLWVF